MDNHEVQNKLATEAKEYIAQVLHAVEAMGCRVAPAEPRRIKVDTDKFFTTDVTDKYLIDGVEVALVPEFTGLSVLDTAVTEYSVPVVRCCIPRKLSAVWKRSVKNGWTAKSVKNHAKWIVDQIRKLRQDEHNIAQRQAERQVSLAAAAQINQALLLDGDTSAVYAEESPVSGQVSVVLRKTYSTDPETAKTILSRIVSVLEEFKIFPVK